MHLALLVKPMQEAIILGWLWILNKETSCPGGGLVAHHLSVNRTKLRQSGRLLMLLEPCYTFMSFICTLMCKHTHTHTHTHALTPSHTHTHTHNATHTLTLTHTHTHNATHTHTHTHTQCNTHTHTHTHTHTDTTGSTYKWRVMFLRTNVFWWSTSTRRRLRTSEPSNSRKWQHFQ